MSTNTTTASSESYGFQHQPQSEDQCTCPIHRSRDRDPFTAPLGLPFADHVTTKPIQREQASDIYEAHHGYMGGNDLHNACLAHHGIFYQSNLMGAITWRYPFFSRKKLHFNPKGYLIPKPYTEADFERLPDAIEHRARELLEETTESDVAKTEVLKGDEFVEANRICIGQRMANLASCSLARSQERFVTSPNTPNDISHLVTYVRSDFRGSMIRALRDRGWKCIGWTEPRQASNREYKEIRDRYKWCFACPVSKIQTQTELDNWC